MNQTASIFVSIKRFAWKEIRQLLPLTLGFLVLALIATFLARITLPFESGQLQAFICNLWFCLFGVLCGAPLFATERENNTLQRLQMFPLTWQPLLAGKISGAAILVSIALPVLLYGISGIWTPWQIPTSSANAAAVPLSGMFLYFAVAIVASLIFNQVTTASLVAVAVGSLIDGALVFAYSTTSTDFLSVRALEPITTLRITIGILLCGVAVPLGKRWWNGKARTRNATGPQTRSLTATTHRAPTQRIGWARPAFRLLWQSARQNIYYVGAVVIVMVVLPSFFAILAYDKFFESLYPHIYLGTTLLGACLAGVFCFAEDQRDQSFRYFSQHAERPWLVWLSRTTFWAFVAIACFGLTSFILGIDTPQPGTRTSNKLAIGIPWIAIVANPETADLPDLYHLLYHRYFLISCVLLVFATGQLVSLSIRSTFVALVVAVVVNIPAVLWNFMCMQVDAAWWWSVLPLTLVALGCGLTWSPAWLAGQRRWKGWVRSVAIMSTVTAALIGVLNVRQANTLQELVEMESWGEQPSDEALLDLRKKYADVVKSLQPRKRPDSDDVSGWELDTAGDGLFHYPDWLLKLASQQESGVSLSVNPISTSDSLYDFDNRSRLYTTIDEVHSALPRFNKVKQYLPTSSAKHYPAQDTDRAPCPVEPLAAIRRPLQRQAYLAIRKHEPEEAWQAIESEIKLSKQYALFYGESHFSRELMLAINAWANLPETTEPQVAYAIQVLQENRTDVWTLLRRSHLFKMELKMSVTDGYQGTTSPSIGQAANQLGLLLIPAEKTRQRKHQQLTGQMSINILGVYQKRLSSWTDGDRPLATYYAFVNADLYDSRFEELRFVSNQLNPLEISYARALAPGDSPLGVERSVQNTIQWRLQQETWYRTALTRLVIELYQLKNHRLPESLSDVVTENILPELPLHPMVNQDKVFGKPLAWNAIGLDKPIYQQFMDGTSPRSQHYQKVARGQPFLVANFRSDLREGQFWVIDETDYARDVRIGQKRGYVIDSQVLPVKRRMKPSN